MLPRSGPERIGEKMRRKLVSRFVIPTNVGFLREAEGFVSVAEGLGVAAGSVRLVLLVRPSPDLMLEFRFF